MGNLLSFPLLCLVNYLAFRYYGGYEETRDLPCKINGDDIVFRGPPRVVENWKRGVVGSGLVLSKGKTMEHRRYFSLNSRLFVSSVNSSSLVPSVRSSAFGYRAPNDPVASLPGRWARVLKDFPCGAARREVLCEEFLRWNARYVVASRRSLTRGLDMKVSYLALVRTSLWKRETWYLSMEKESPLPASPGMCDEQRIPEGWECVRVTPTKEVMEASKGIGAAFIAQAWDTSGVIKALGSYKDRLSRYKEKVAMSPYYSPRSGPRRSTVFRMLMCEEGFGPFGYHPRTSGRDVYRWSRPAILRDGRVVRSPEEILRVSRPVGKRVWLPVGFFIPTLSTAEKGVALREVPLWKRPVAFTG